MAVIDFNDRIKNKLDGLRITPPEQAIVRPKWCDVIIIKQECSNASNFWVLTHAPGSQTVNNEQEDLQNCDLLHQEYKIRRLWCLSDGATKLWDSYTPNGRYTSNLSDVQPGL